MWNVLGNSGHNFLQKWKDIRNLLTTFCQPITIFLETIVLY